MIKRIREATQTTPVDEPLALSAPVARAKAAALCAQDPLSAGTCAWYHGFWQYVRLLGLGASPSVHAECLLPTLRSLARNGGHERVLISGSADYSMLAHVISAYANEKAPLRPMVIDICDTPLYMSRWYAERLSVAIDTERCDIRTFARPQSFDVVCTHAFLGYFAPDERAEVLSNWATLLRPGGRVLTIQRIRPMADRRVLRFTPGEKAAFIARIDQAVQCSEDLGDASRTWLVASARQYAERFWTHPVSSLDELAHLFEHASFDIETLDVSAPHHRETEKTSGPTLPTGAEYAFVMARRR